MVRLVEGGGGLSVQLPSPVFPGTKGTKSNGIGEILEENEKGKGITSPNWAEVDTIKNVASPVVRPLIQS